MFRMFSQRRFQSFQVLPVLLFMAVLAAPRCGQPVPPTGGPRDTLPPLLKGANPADSSINVKGNRITLQFDEYVSLDNPFEKITYSPVPEKAPQVESKLKTVTIRLKDTLEPNTTYSIDFGEAIQDINENNKLKDFRYVFSTGPKIDSGLIRGRVFLAETGKTDSTLIVVLHRGSDDSAVAKQRPRYVARVNRNGDFVFRYLAPGDYAIFALKDIDGQKRYDQASEMIGFLDKRVVADQPEAVTLYAFSEETEPVTEPPAGPASQPGVQKSKDDKRLRFNTNLEGNKLDILGDFTFSFENKLASYDSAKLIFTDEQFKPIRNYTLTQDSNRRKLTVRHTWVPDKKYKFIIQREFAKDTAGNFVAPTDTLDFQAKNESDYGGLTIRVRNLDTTMGPVLQLYQNDKLELSMPLRAERQSIRLMRPADYEVRILYDRNRNRRWDTGSYWEKRQPERVVGRKQNLNVRANWDNELEIDLREMQLE